MSQLPEIRCKKCGKLISKGLVLIGNLQCKCGYLNEFKPISNVKHREKEDRKPLLNQ